MSGVLPPEMVVRVLNPIIKTGDFPVNQAAIKMLSKLVEKQTADSMEPHVGEVMPGLLKVSLAERNVDLTNSSFSACRPTTTWRAVSGRPPCSALWLSTNWWGRTRSSLTWTA